MDAGENQPTSPQRSASRGSGWAPLAAGMLAIVLVTVLAYMPALNAGYIWDDDSYLTQNPIITDPDGLLKIWSSITATPQFYPLVFSSFWIEHRVWGFDPIGYHAINIALHAATSCLVWIALRRLGVRGGFLAAMVFAVHPVHVESVAWVTERKNTLSGFFYLAALLSYLSFVRIVSPRVDEDGTTREPPRLAWRFYALSLVFFLLALLAKTITCSLPAALVLILWWKRRSFRWAEHLPLLPMFALGLVAAKVTVWVEQHHVDVISVKLGLDPLDRLLIAGRAAWFYLGKLLIPVDLTFIYPRWDVDPKAMWQWLYPAGGALVVVVLWLMRQRIGKGPLVAVFYFVGTLVPALGFIDVYPMRYSFVADHFQYLASLGPIALAGAVLAQFLAPPAVTPGRTLLDPPRIAAAAALLVMVLAPLTFRQCRIYKDAETLWRDTIARNPDAWMAYNNLGGIMVQSGRVAEGEQCFLKSLELHPNHAEALHNLALISLARGDGNRAFELSRQAVRADPRKLEAMLVGVRALLAARRLDEALEWARSAVNLARERAPDVYAPYQLLGAVYIKLDRARDAADPLAEAVRLGATDTETMSAMALALAAQGRTDEATELCRSTLAKSPGAYFPQWVAASILAENGSIEEPVRTLRKLVDDYPSLPDAIIVLADILRRDPETLAEAARLADRAARFDPSSPRVRRLLADIQAAQRVNEK